jgi:hypothetical protein
VPTTLAGLLIFVVLLMPGFAYLVGKERQGTERRASPFRETVAIVAASVASEIFVLALFGVARWQWPSITPDVGALVRGPDGYLVGTGTTHGNYGEVSTWALGLLALATVVAYSATSPRVRRIASKLPLIGPYPHDSTVSGWWLLFEKFPRGRLVEVGCILDDGSFFCGYLASFNNSADDMPDRDLILRPPIRYRAPGARESVPYPVTAVCITASRIVSMTVAYEEPTAVAEITPSQESTAVAGPAVADPVVAELLAADLPSDAGRSSDPSPHPGP